jgi:hypothetical protein
MRTSHIAVLFFVLLPIFSLAQNNYTYGVLPSANINYKLPRDWFTNFKAESRQELYKNDFEYTYKLTELSFGAGTKVGLRTKVAAGYQLGIANREVFHRFIQQVSHVNKFPSFTLAHRLQTDQTTQKDEDTEYRIRYRLSAEVPLSGQTTDPREFYLKFSNEYLNSIQSSEYDLEIRVAGFIGYVFTPKTKIETGFDNRTDSFILDRRRNRFWLGLNFYWSI